MLTRRGQSIDLALKLADGRLQPHESESAVVITSTVMLTQGMPHERPALKRRHRSNVLTERWVKKASHRYYDG